MSYKCLNNKIAFQFVEKIASGAFRNETTWGFQICNPVHDVKLPRWGFVRNVGPDVKHVKEGDYVLIEPMMWTLKMNFDNEEFWATSEEKVLAHSAELPDGIV